TIPAVPWAVPRIVLGVVLLAIVSCSAKSTKDGQNVDRKGLTGEKLIDSFDGDRKGVAADILFLGNCYVDHWENKNRAPANNKELEKFAMNPEEPERLKRNVRDNIDIIWNLKPTEKLLDKTVFVYERNADKDGHRVVMTRDGKLRFM